MASSSERVAKTVQTKKPLKVVKRYSLDTNVESRSLLFMLSAREISGTSKVKQEDRSVSGKIIRGITIP